MQRITASLLTKREGEYMLLHEIQLNDLVQKEFQLRVPIKFPSLPNITGLINTSMQIIYMYLCFLPKQWLWRRFQTW